MASMSTHTPSVSPIYFSTSNHIRDLAREILTFVHTGHMCGKLTVISWKHSEIAKIARHLGCGPMEGCPVDYRGKFFDQVWQIKFVHRKFKHSIRKSLKLSKKSEWRVFGSAQPENFDPLMFSHAYGDYPRGGTLVGGRWEKMTTNLPERRSPHHSNNWKATRVGFEDLGP